LAKPGTWIQRWRVPLGFVCAAIFFLLSRPGPLTLVVGGAIALPGLALRAWATGHLRKNDALAVTGPYAYTRNPLYLGSFLIGVGFTIASGRPVLGILFAALFLGIYVPVMRVESATLAKLFGESYQRYLDAVPLFLPRLSPYRDGSKESARFDSALYKRYREYQAAMGLAVAWALLALKAFIVSRF
jgi:protein-S-isoprenylcysteine O-methyltransferase Ste14